MRKRRYHITKAQGEVISLALASSIAEIERICNQDPSPYWPWMLERSKMLKQEIDGYQWEVDEKEA